MEIARARFVASEAARAALEALPAGLADLPLTVLSTHLRRSFAPEDAAALGEQIHLRRRALERFQHLPLECMAGPGLEMMTHPQVAARRAARMRMDGLPVADLTCGIGGDLSAIAATGVAVRALERDAATAILAAANVPAANVIRGDARRPPFALHGLSVLVDPARREGVARRWDPSAFTPPWDVAVAAASEAAAGVIKAPPGIAHDHVPPAAEVEFVQLGRSMREATLWFGPGATPGLRRAVLLPRGVELCSSSPESGPSPRPLGTFVFDPESCVTRAGLVRHLGAVIGAELLDERIAYLSSAQPAANPLCACFEVLDAMPFSVSRLRSRLVAARWAPREIRRRGFPVEPDELGRLLGKIEGEPITLLCTTISGRRTVVVGRRVDGVLSLES